MRSPHPCFDPPIVGSSAATQCLRDLVLTLADSSVSVLITGDSGVGKEVLARNLHRFSPRAHAAFVSVNCAALAPGILESELFGHDRGAFTGAVRAHAGLFEQASGGTLFLDEIGEIPPYIQAKLLRVLQEGEVRRMGEGGVRRVDVRLISATNADLAHMVGDGSFRKDLFYRINVVEARVPSLRERREDVVDLVAHFFERRGLDCPDVPTDTGRVLSSYPWPGNVRELENEVERIAALHGAPVRLLPEMLSERILCTAAAATLDVAVLHEAPLASAVGHLEESLLKKTLAQTNWNKSHAARRLGLSRQGLLKKIKRYGIAREAAVDVEKENRA
ncbi:MAG: sigma-54 dependent transcriptional regulator [Candidatus Latescibacteria bacterium]|nr:sigma-54 dependent transcriptional regulator [Candidatus Latescibacterota bacterium]